MRIIYGKDFIISIIGLIIGIAVVIYIGQEQTPFDPLDNCADIFITGGNIWTGTSKKVEAVSIKGKYIMKAGLYEDVLNTFCAKHTITIPLEDRMMTPGWIDTHVHGLLGGMDLLSVQVSDVDSHEMLAERIEDYLKTMEPGEWLVGSGWNQERFKGDQAGISPHRKLIDKVSPNNPVWICRLDLHQCIANTLALKEANIDLQNPPKVLGGVFAMDEEGVTGIVKDNAMKLIVNAIPTVSVEKTLKGLQTAMNYFVSNGVTSVNQVVNDIFTDLEEGWSTFEQLYESTLPGKFSFIGERNIRATPFVRTYFAPALALYKEAAELVKNNQHLDDTFLRLGYVKGFLDGSLGSYTAKMFEPYLDNIQGGPENNTGILLVPEKEMYEWVKGADALDLQVCVHAIGSKAVNTLLNIFERVINEVPKDNRRFRIEHCQHMIPSDVPRLAELGIIASVQPYHLIDDAIFIKRALGEHRFHTAYPFRSLLDYNTKLSFGSDWNVAPAAPLTGIHAAVTRSYRDISGEIKQFEPNQCITVDEALRAYTTDAAYAEYTEHIKGKIQEGYLADLVIIDKDITKINPMDIDKAKVQLTILDGQIVYQTKHIKVIEPVTIT